MDEKLRLNRDTGYYEATITLAVEAEILQRALAQYIEEHHVDISIPDEVQKAVEQVSRLSRWVDHPRTKKIVQVRSPEKPPVSEPLPPEQPKPKAHRFLSHGRIPKEFESEFRARALATPVDEWETLLTPLAPIGTDLQDRKGVYRLRDSEKAILKKLKAELEAPAPDRMEAIADAVNGARIR